MPPRLSKAKVQRCGLPSKATFQEVILTRTSIIEEHDQGRAMKYLKESNCHRIECSATNSLDALMWK